MSAITSIELAPLVGAFDRNAFLGYLTPDDTLWKALWTTVYISVAAQVLGTLLGLAVALGGMSRAWPLRVVCGIYVWFFRGTPVIVQIFFWYLGASILFEIDLFPRNIDLYVVTLSGAAVAGITALAINEGAYMAEIIRAGIGSVDPGQTEAALSVGMTQGEAMRRVVLPQAARVIVPGLGNEFNNMLKTSSLLTFIGVYELFQNAQVWQSEDFQPVEVYIAVAIWYLGLTTIWALVQVQLERYLGRSDRADDERWFTRMFGVGSPLRNYA